MDSLALPEVLRIMAMQAFSGIGWAALSRLSIIVSTVVFGNLAGRLRRRESRVHAWRPTRGGDGNDVRHITLDYLSCDADYGAARVGRRELKP
jgi:hypothetical protein